MKSWILDSYLSQNVSVSKTHLLFSTRSAQEVSAPNIAEKLLTGALSIETFSHL